VLLWVQAKNKEFEVFAKISGANIKLNLVDFLVFLILEFLGKINIF